MPFYWSQLPNLRYKPRPHKVNGKDHLLACKRHFEEQIALYGQQVLVNLVKKSVIRYPYLLIYLILYDILHIAD